METYSSFQYSASTQKQKLPPMSYEEKTMK